MHQETQQAAGEHPHRGLDRQRTAVARVATATVHLVRTAAGVAEVAVPQVSMVRVSLVALVALD
jgi:hypothetical protein